MNKNTKAILAAIQKSNGCVNAATLTYTFSLKIETIKRICMKLVELGFIVNEPTCDGNVCYYTTQDGRFELGIFN